MKDTSIVGDIVNFRGIVYAPTNELGVVHLFGNVFEELDIKIEEFKNTYPDCTARRFIGKGWERINIEFEYKSKNFLLHNHDPNGCDLIVCWEHDWPECPIEVIELKTEIKNLPNNCAAKKNKHATKDNTAIIQNNLSRYKFSDSFTSKFFRLCDDLLRINENIWTKVTDQQIGFFAASRSFTSAKIHKKGFRVNCFSRGTDINGTSAISHKSCPRWRTFFMDENCDTNKAFLIIKESYHLHLAAVTAGESTSWISGGN